MKCGTQSLCSIVVNEIWELGNCRKCANKETSSESTEIWRRQCGCIRTSDKLRKIIECFPAPPPPSPVKAGPSTYSVANHNPGTCISAFCAVHQPSAHYGDEQSANDSSVSMIVNEKEAREADTGSRRPFNVVTDLVQLLQLSVTATALALYYLIYCYMQLVYYTLRSALYFHNADGPMKITIGVVTLTSLVVGFNLLARIERLIFIFN
ncbi:uncharacterized protein [Battus philenor]|uniref:uncharacterized protein n=1 Tax=Battus philenor TaxID=42288 RepID=UPI0035CFBB73